MSKRAKIIIGIVGVVVLAGAGATIIFWPAVSGFVAQFFRLSEQDNGEAGNITSTIGGDSKLYDDAVAAAVSDGPEAGQAVLDQRLSETTDKAEKSAIYSQKASLATTPVGGNNTTQALEFAYQAEDEDPSYATAILIADLEYYVNNNKSAALTYYKLYLDRLTDEAIELNPGDKAYYEQLVQEIEASL